MYHRTSDEAMGLAGVLRGKEVRTRNSEATHDRVNRQFVAERSDPLWVADFIYGVPGVQGEHGCIITATSTMIRSRDDISPTARLGYGWDGMCISIRWILYQLSTLMA